MEDSGRSWPDPHSSTELVGRESTLLWQVQGLTQPLIHHMTLSRAIPPLVSKERVGLDKPQGPFQSDIPIQEARPGTHGLGTPHCPHRPQPHVLLLTQNPMTRGPGERHKALGSCWPHPSLPAGTGPSLVAHPSIPAHTASPYISPTSPSIPFRVSVPLTLTTC